MTPRRWFTSLAPPGAASASGSTSTTAVSATITPAAAPRPSRTCWRSHSHTGQVVNTRIAAHSSDEKNGYSTSTQPTPIPPSSNANSTRSAVMRWSIPPPACSLPPPYRGGPRCHAWLPTYP